jgi:Rne/Rng family ribonuclease
VRPLLVPNTRYVSLREGHLVGALREDERTLQFDIAAGGGLRRGTLVRGRVDRVLPALGACFVRIGDVGSVFLRGTEYPDFDRVKVGNELILQVKVPARGTKAARATGAISIPGRSLVYLPHADGCRISKKIPERDRQKMNEWYASRPVEKGGWILRTLAGKLSARDWDAEAERLKARWRSLQDSLLSSGGLGCVPLHEDPVDPWILAMPAAPAGEMIVDGVELHERIEQRIGTIAPQLESTLKLFDGPDLFAAVGLDRDLRQALNPSVWLPSGGALRIDTHAALTAIDIDTAGTSSAGDARRTTDLEAVREIPHQLRLRGIGGMVVVDLIELDRTEDRKEVEQVLREALMSDNVRTRLSILEEPWLAVIVRERDGSSLLEEWSTTCSSCSGSGRTARDR